jgi:hypothetical protein
MPRSNRLCCPGWGGKWFGGKSSTRIAPFFIRLRNSSGSESNASSAALTKCSRFILHPLKRIRARSLRVAVVCFVIIVIFFFFAVAVAFVFLFVFLIVWLLSKGDIGSYRPIRTV